MQGIDVKWTHEQMEEQEIPHFELKSLMLI